MSERDIPSRFTDGHGHPGGMVERSTIAASKSVPALHQVVDSNDPPNVPQRVISNTLASGPVQNLLKNHHENFNPAYSRTSSSNSINTTNSQPLHPNTMAPPKSKSIHNLVSPNAGQDQGFYQNLSVYRNKPSEPLTLGDRASALRSSQSSLHSNNPLSPNNINNNQRPASAYYSNSPLANNHPVAQRPNQLLLTSHHHQSIPNLKTTQSPSMMMNHQNNYPQTHDQHPHLKSSQSQSALLANNNYPLDKNEPQYRQHSSMTALVRGQAKIAEMGEEVRRRQTRGMLSPQNDYRTQPQHTPLTSRIGDYPQQGQQSQQPQQGQQPYMPPNGGYPNQHPQQQTGNNYYEHQEQQYYANKNSVYSPPGTKPKPDYEEDPPPIPPTTTHPLYTANVIEPQKGTYYSPGQRENKGAANPWEREEREKV